MYRRGEEISYQSHPGAWFEYGFVERDDGGPLVLCRFWNHTRPADLRTKANGEKVPRDRIEPCESGHSAQDIHLALGFYCADAAPAEGAT